MKSSALMIALTLVMAARLAGSQPTGSGIQNGETRSYPYASFDGGKRWIRGRITGDTRVVMGADPLVYITRAGTSFFSTLPPVKGGYRSVISRSTDGGRTWSSSITLPYADRHWMAFAAGGGPFSRRIYFTGTGVHSSREGERAVSPFLARSDDDGRTFPFRSVVAYDRGGADPQAPLNAVPLEPLVTSSGLFILPLQGPVERQTLERLARDSLTARGVGLVVSDDGGESFGAARYAPAHLTMMTGSPRRRFRAHSAFGYIRTAIDASSGRYRNRIYFAAPDYDASIDRYVARVWRTGDFGKTWGTAVASDAPRGDVANPAIAVNRDGVVAVTWNDRRDDPTGRCWQLYAAVSTDGGEHFLPAQRLSRRPTCTNEPRNWETFGTAFNGDQGGQQLAYFQTGASIPTRFPNGGDTQGLVADGAGVFHAAWINGETGVMQLWHTSFRLDPGLLAPARSTATSATNGSEAIPLVPPGMEDLTPDIRFRVTNTRLDFAAHSWSVTLRIENQSGRALRGPFRAVMVKFLDARDRGAGLENLEVANADGGGRGVGATWTFPVPGGVLAPGALSASRVLRFRFGGGIPDVPDGEYLTPGFRVFGRSP
jgi:hypothetical protein